MAFTMLLWSVPNTPHTFLSRTLFPNLNIKKVKVCQCFLLLLKLKQQIWNRDSSYPEIICL